MDKRYNDYNSYLKKKYGVRVQKVSVDVGFTCPNRDGSVAIGGCVYCNNSSFVPPYATSRFSLRKQLDLGTKYLSRRYNAQKFIVYFQAYTNTYDNTHDLEQLYREALDYEGVIGLVVGTRADCMDEDKLDLFERLAGETDLALEYGIESIYDHTLEFVNRGHDYAAVRDMILRTKSRGISTGAHVIAGFPTETVEQMLEMALEVSCLGVDFLKVHNLHIIRNTQLQRMYLDDPFPLFTFEEYLDFIINFLELLDPNIVIERLFTNTPKDLLVAPNWGLSPVEITRAIEDELVERGTYQGRLYDYN